MLLAGLLLSSSFAGLFFSASTYTGSRQKRTIRASAPNRQPASRLQTYRRPITDNLFVPSRERDIIEFIVLGAIFTVGLLCVLRVFLKSSNKRVKILHTYLAGATNVRRKLARERIFTDVQDRKICQVCTNAVGDLRSRVNQTPRCRKTFHAMTRD